MGRGKKFAKNMIFSDFESCRKSKKKLEKNHRVAYIQYNDSILVKFQQYNDCIKITYEKKKVQFNPSELLHFGLNKFTFINSLTLQNVYLIKYFLLS